MLYHYVHTSVHTTHASASSPRTRTERSHLSRSTIPYVKSFMRSPSINYLAVTSLRPLEWQKQHHVRPVSISGTLIIDLSEAMCSYKVDCSDWATPTAIPSTRIRRHCIDVSCMTRARYRASRMTWVALQRALRQGVNYTG